MMIDALDQAPAAEAEQPTEPAAAPSPAPAAPASRPAPAAEADLDLLSDADGDAGDDGDEGGGAPAQVAEEGDADRPAWRRPEGLAGDALVEWKEQQGLPTDANGYEIKLAEGEAFSETGKQMAVGLRSLAADLDLPAAVPQRLVEWYRAQEKAQEAKLAEADKALLVERREVLTEQWGDSYGERLDLAREGARVLPAALRQALKGARTADGRSVANLPELAVALYEIGRLRSRKGTPTVSDEVRLAEIARVRDTDITRYEREGLSAEALAIMRKRDAAKADFTPGTLTAAEEAEMEQLVTLRNTDINAYAYRPWRASGKSGSDRALELARKKAGR